jgi:putative nucleotidyltransferase with HDIG domain
MPASVVQLASMATDMKSSMEEMARVIEYDEALTANLLRLANSVWGKALTPVLTVKDAVVRLGTGQILKFAVGQQISDAMCQPCPGYELTEHELWRHSVAGALAAEHLSDCLYQPVPRLVFTAALIHDIGKLLLGRQIGHDTLDEIKKVIEYDHLTFLEGERQLLGTDHAEVGGSIARYWKFPEPLITAIELHHDPDRQPDALLDIVHLSNVMAKFIGVGLGSEAMNLNASGSAPKRLGISAEKMESICASVRIELLEAEKFFFAKEKSA